MLHLDEVLRRQGLRDGDSECNSVVLFHVLLLQQEELMMQHILAVTILHNDPEGLHKPMQCVLQRIMQCDTQHSIATHVSGFQAKKNCKTASHFHTVWPATHSVM